MKGIILLGEVGHRVGVLRWLVCACLHGLFRDHASLVHFADAGRNELGGVVGDGCDPVARRFVQDAHFVLDRVAIFLGHGHGTHRFGRRRCRFLRRSSGRRF